MALVGDDCFFFLNSGCVRGSQCTFRHQPAARSTTVVCPQWMQRCCFQPNCGLRHSEDRPQSRNQTPCYFESSMGVCYKPRCSFVHAHKPAAPVAAIQVPLPVLPPHPPVLPVMPPLLPPNPIGIPPPLNVPLPNTVPQEAVKTPATSAVIENAGPQIIRAPLTPPPPVLPPPPKLAEMLLGSRPPLELAPPPSEAGSTPVVDQRPPISTQEVVSAPPHNVSILGAAPVNVFPKNEHFSEQVRRFKQMLATKGAEKQKKYKEKDNGYSDDEKTGGIYKVKERSKERQRSKKEHKEREGHTSHKGSKASKEAWSKADEEILYGDYIDVPLDKKSKKKKRKAHKERVEKVHKERVEKVHKEDVDKVHKERTDKVHKDHDDSDTEVQVKSYEEILREKALRKMFVKRKEKFNEDFKELVVLDDEVAEKVKRVDEENIPVKNHQKNVPPRDKVIHKVIHKKYDDDTVIHKNMIRYDSDSDEIAYSDDSVEGTEGNFKRRNYRAEDLDKFKPRKKRVEKVAQKCKELEYHLRNSDIKDQMLKNAIIDSQKRQDLRQNKNITKQKERRVDEGKKCDLNEVKVTGVSRKGKMVEKITLSPGAEYIKESSNDTTDSDSDSDSESSGVSNSSRYSNKESSKYSNKEGSKYSSKEASKYSNKEGSKYSNKEVSKYSNKEGSKYNNKEEIIIPDETTNIDFIVDNDDDLAMEIHQSEKAESVPTKTKKISSVVSVINKGPSSFEKTMFHKSLKERDLEEHNIDDRHHKYNHDDFPKKVPKSKDRNQEGAVDNLDKPAEKKKVVRLVNTSDEPFITGRVSPSVVPAKNDSETGNKKPISPIKASTVKVKSFEEIMAEKQRRNKSSVAESHDVIPVTDNSVVPKSLNATLKEKSIQAKLEILDMPTTKHVNNLATSVGGAKSVGKCKGVAEEEKGKRKSLQLYKPPHPGKPESELSGMKTTEIKMVVNTGARKIIRIRKASLSTDLIDQPSVSETVEVPAAHDGDDEKESIKVRSFEEIIREKRLRQKKERELAKQMEEASQMEKENASSLVAPVTSTSNNMLRRKPVLRRPPVVTCSNSSSSSDSLSSSPTLSANTSGSYSTSCSSASNMSNTSPSGACSSSNTLASLTSNSNTCCYTTNSITNVLVTIVTSSVSNSVVGTSNRDIANGHNKTDNNNSKRPLPNDANIAKVSPLMKVVPQKRVKSDLPSTPEVAATADASENKDCVNTRRSSRRASVATSNAVKDIDKNQTASKSSERNESNAKLRKRSGSSERTPSNVKLRKRSGSSERNESNVKLRKRSVPSSHEPPSALSSNHVNAQKVLPYKFDTSLQSITTNEENIENRTSSRRDIQEALDEEKRKREQDILSDDEFEKEINELGSDDDGDDIEDINEDDLLMELEQMIDS